MRLLVTKARNVALVVVLLARAAAAEAIPTAADKADSAPTVQKPADTQVHNGDTDWTYDASLFEEYRLRIASHALPTSGPLGEPLRTNQQTDQHFRMLADGQVSGFDDHFRATLSAALWLDLDGPSAPGTASLFATQYDYAQPWFTVYSLSAEWQKYMALDHLRVGRQAAEHGMPLTFDGVSIGLRPLAHELLVFGFGGRTVHFFETTPGWFENWVASTGAVVQPTRSTTFEFDSRLIREQTFNVDRSLSNPITNHSYGVAASFHSLNLMSKVYARGIDRQPSHLGAAFLYQHERLGLGLDAHVNAQLVTLGEVVESENPFYSLLGRSLPYVRFHFDAWKDFALDQLTHLNIHLGWRERQLVGAREEPFNRNTGAVYLNVRVDDLVRKGLFVSATAERDYVPHAFNREWLLVFGGSAGYATPAVSTEVGTYFQQYKIIYYQNAQELPNTRTVFGSVGYTPAPWLQLRARYELEIFDRYLQSFFLSARQEF